MTGSELEEQIERAVLGFSQIEGVTEEVAQSLVEQGYLSYDDLSVIEPDQFMEMSGLSAEDVDRIVETAETMGEEAEQAAAEERRVRREKEQLQKQADAEAAAAAPESTEAESADSTETEDSAAPPESAAEAETSEAAATEPVSGEGEEEAESAGTEKS